MNLDNHLAFHFSEHSESRLFSARLLGFTRGSVLRKQYALWSTIDGLEIACTEEFLREFMEARSERHKYTSGGEMKMFTQGKRFYVGFDNEQDSRNFAQALHAWSDASDLMQDYVARECLHGYDFFCSEKFCRLFAHARRQSKTYLSKGIIALTASCA